MLLQFDCRRKPVIEYCPLNESVCRGASLTWSTTAFLPSNVSLSKKSSDDTANHLMIRVDQSADFSIRLVLAMQIYYLQFSFFINMDVSKFSSDSIIVLAVLDLNFRVHNDLLRFRGRRPCKTIGGQYNTFISA